MPDDPKDPRMSGMLALAALVVIGGVTVIMVLIA